MANVIKFLIGDFSNANRDKREISTLVEVGCEVIVVCPGDKTEIKMSNDGFLLHQIKKLNITLKQPKPLRLIKIMWYYLKLVGTLKSLKSDLISCHDLIALFIGWLSTWFTPRNNNRPLLVYDSHEFEIGRNTGGKRSKIRTAVILKMEKFLIGKSAFTMMVNDSIADEVQNIYKLKTRPVVVRNITNYWDINQRICKDKRKELSNMLKVPDTTFLIMYHGAVTTGRGIENLIRAVGKIDNTVAIVLGFGQKGYVQELKTLVDDVGVGRKVLFHDAVPIKTLWQYVGSVDLGAMIDQNICKSYYYSLPNKLFENIQAETPVISSNFPEYKRIVEGYNVGLCCDPHNVDEIVETIEKLRNDKVLYAKMKENLKIAKKELCWENEKKILIKEYSRVFE